MIRRSLPLAIAIIFGLLTLIGLLLPLPELSDLVLSWAGFLAAVALLLGVLNLFTVHLNRLFIDRNLYSGILLLSMLAVFALAITDSTAVNLTENGVTAVFNWIQAPLEAALASLLAFFLLLAGFQLLKRQRTIWTILFLITVVLVLSSNALLSSTLLPPEANSLLRAVQDTIANVFVTAGMRGILIGVALGAITLSLRLLVGVERPYNK
jgi:hypothetical protein